MNLPRPSHIAIASSAVAEIKRENKRLRVKQPEFDEHEALYVPSPIAPMAKDDPGYFPGQPNAQVWYVSREGKGFTQNSRLALLDRRGAPVLAPGNMVQIIQAMVTRTEAVKAQWKTSWLDKMWDLLFETLEEEVEGNKEKMRRSATASGLAKAISILTYGNAEEENLDKVRQEAAEAYEEDDDADSAHQD